MSAGGRLTARRFLDYKVLLSRTLGRITSVDALLIPLPLPETTTVPNFFNVLSIFTVGKGLIFA